MIRFLLVFILLFYTKRSYSKEYHYRNGAIELKMQIVVTDDSIFVSTVLKNTLASCLYVQAGCAVCNGDGINFNPSYVTVEMGAFYESFDNSHSMLYLYKLPPGDSIMYGCKAENTMKNNKLLLSFDYLDVARYNKKKGIIGRKIKKIPDSENLYTGDRSTLGQYFDFFILKLDN